MKRVNENTNKYFKEGDIREDGYIFKCYKLNLLKKDGYFQEHWQAPNVGAKRKQKNSGKCEKYRASQSGRATSLLLAAKARTVKNGGKITVSKDWVLSKLENGKCELTNLPFDLSNKNPNFRNPYSPSLDRIDSKNRDYTPDNTRLVLTAVNMALNEFSLETMSPIFKALSKL